MLIILILAYNHLQMQQCSNGKVYTVMQHASLKQVKHIAWTWAYTTFLNNSGNNVQRHIQLGKPRYLTRHSVKMI